MLSSLILGYSQQQFDFEGNGTIAHDAATRLTVKSYDSLSNSLIRFGSNDVAKFSFGYNASMDILQLCAGNTIGSNSFTMGINSFTNRFAINSVPTAHRFLIRHNSTSGASGSSHLTLQENDIDGFGRVRFQNEDEDGYWLMSARSTNGQSRFKLKYDDGLNAADIMSVDGDLFRVGIHQNNPDAYLHIKQSTAGVDALKFENDDSTGGEIWGWRVGDNDILIYFEGGLRGSFCSDDGVYTNFPPPPPPANSYLYKSNPDEFLEQFRQIRSTIYKNKSGRVRHVIDPYQLQKVNKDWVVFSEDKTKLGINHEQLIVLSIEAVKEQQNIIDSQAKKIEELEKSQIEILSRVAAISAN